jgi:hypothetical protein
MRIFLISSVLTTLLTVLFTSQSYCQTYKKEFELYDLNVEGKKVSLTPKKDLAKFIGNSPIEINDYFLFLTSTRSDDSLFTDSKDGQIYILNKYISGVYDSLPIINSGKYLIGNLFPDYNQLQHDLIIKNRSYNNYIKIQGKYLVVSVPSKPIESVIYKHNGDNGPEYDQDGNIVEYGRQIIPSGHLFIYDMEKNKIILDKKHVSMLNLNDDGVFYGGQFLDSLQDFSFIKWNGQYIFQNLKLAELFQDKENLKTIIGNCNNIYNVNENLPFDLMKLLQGLPPSFRYTTKNGNSGYFDFSGIHQVYENKMVFDDNFYLQNQRFHLKTNINLSFPVFQIINAETRVENWTDEFGNSYYDTIKIEADTIYTEIRNVDTIIHAKYFLGRTKVNNNQYGSLPSIISDELKNMDDYIINNPINHDFFWQYKGFYKRNNLVLFNDPGQFHIDIQHKIVCWDPTDPTTCDYLLDEYGYMVVDWELTNYSTHYEKQQLLIYDTKNNKIEQFVDKAFCSQNEDGILNYQFEHLINYDYTGNNYENPSSNSHHTKNITYFTFDTVQMKIRNQFRLNEILKNPESFLTSFLGSNKFKLVETLWEFESFYYTDTIFVIKYQYKGKERILSNSQKIIDYYKTKQIIGINNTLYYADKKSIQSKFWNNKSPDTLNLKSVNFDEKVRIPYKKFGQYFVFSVPTKIGSVPIYTKPDEMDPSTWYSMYDALGNQVVDHYIEDPGFLTILDDKLKSIYHNSHEGVISKFGNVLLTNTIEKQVLDNGSNIIRNKYSLLTKNNYSLSVFNFEKLLKKGYSTFYFPDSNINNYISKYFNDFENNPSNLIEINSNEILDLSKGNENTFSKTETIPGLIIPTKINNKIGLIDLSGNKRSEFEYDEVRFRKFDGKEFYILSNEKKTIIYDYNGKLIKSLPETQVYFINSNHTNNHSIILKGKNGYFKMDNLLSPNKTILPDSLFQYKLITLGIDYDENGNEITNYQIKNHFNAYRNGMGVRIFQETKFGWMVDISDNHYYPEYRYVLKSGRELPISISSFAITNENDDKIHSSESNQYLIIKQKTDSTDANGYLIEKYFLYHIDGTKVLSNSFKEIKEESENILKLVSDKGIQLYNVNTKKLSPLFSSRYNWSNYSILPEGIIENGKLSLYFIYQNPESLKYGVMDSDFNTILQTEYDDIDLLNNYNFYVVKNNGSSLYDSKGKNLYPNATKIIKVKDVFTEQLSKEYFIIKENKKQLFIGLTKNTMLETDSIELAAYSSGDYLIRIKTDKNFVLMDTTGRKILERDYFLILAFENGFAMYVTNSKLRGIINQNGNEVVPAKNGQDFFVEKEKPFIPLNIYKGTLVMSDSTEKYGLISVDNNIILEPKYKKISVLKEGIYAILNDNGWGIVDYTGKIMVENKHRWIYQPDSIGNIKFKQRIITQKGKSIDTSITFGMYDVNFNEIIPHKMDYLIDEYVKNCNCYPLIDNNGQKYFYLVTKNEITNDPNKLENNEYFKYQFADEKINFSPEWNSTKGLNDEAVTAFFEDDNGNYWIGSGAKGGVLFSSDKGKTWEKKDKGLGNVHVTLIGKIDGKIVIEEFARHIYYLDENDFWILVDKDSLKYHFRNELLENAEENFNALNIELNSNWGSKTFSEANNIWEIQDEVVHTLNEYSFEDYKDYNYVYYSTHLTGLNNGINFLSALNNNSFVDSTIFKNYFKQEINLLRSGNFFKLSNGKIGFICDKGFFELNKNEIIKVNINSIDNGAILQLLKTDDNSIYALTDDSKIWKLNKNKWQLILDLNTNELLNSDSNITLKNKINEIRKDKNDLTFSYKGCIYQMDAKGKLKQLIKRGRPNENFIYDEVSYHSVVRKNDSYYGILSADDHQFLFKWDKGKISIIHELNRYYSGFAFIFSDNNHDIWIQHSDYLMRMKNDSTFTDSLYCYGIQSLNQISISGNKSLSLINFSNIFSYDYEAKKWSTVPIQSIYESGRMPVNSLATNEAGDYFIGTGKNYHSQSEEFSNIYYTYGMSKVSHNGKEHELKKIHSAPNNWITSILPYKDGFMVGTYGSGVGYIETKKKK